jgi:hypothetical protein
MRRRELRRSVPGVILAAAALLPDAGAPAAARGENPAGLRVVVVAQGETDGAVLREIKAFGFDTIAGNGPASLETALAAQDAGLSYLGFISTRDAGRLATDPEFRSSIGAVASIPSFAGFHYLDEEVEEGFTSPGDQAAAYAALKAAFPGKLVLYPLRADLVATDPRYLEDYFRPDYTDLVVPYFYPIGTTTLGAFSCDGDWRRLLSRLLAPIRLRVPPGKGVLPVLQAFEQAGFPVDEDFPRSQMDAYEELWPGNPNFASFAWFTISDHSTGIAGSPTLRAGFRRLLEAAGKPPDLREEVTPETVRP